MLLRYSLNETTLANIIEQAVELVLDSNLRTADIKTTNTTEVSTSKMGDAVVQALQTLSK